MYKLQFENIMTHRGQEVLYSLKHGDRVVFAVHDPNEMMINIENELNRLDQHLEELAQSVK